MLVMCQVLLDDFQELRRTRDKEFQPEIIKLVPIDSKIELTVNQQYFFIIRSQEVNFANVGFLSIATTNSMVKLRDIEIFEAFQQIGIASQIIDLLIQSTKFSGLDAIRLVVFNHRQPAINLYKKFNFIKIKQFQHSVSMQLFV